MIAPRYLNAALAARLRGAPTIAIERSVRARSAAIVATDGTALLSIDVAAMDGAADVRVAIYAAQPATAPPAEAAPALLTLVDDRDADVRMRVCVAAIASPDRARLAIRATTDPAPQVRTAAVAVLDDDDVLARLATTDDSPELRTIALVQLAGRRGRAAITSLLLERLATSPPGSAERVRVALAWLLAH